MLRTPTKVSPLNQSTLRGSESIQVLMCSSSAPNSEQLITAFWIESDPIGWIRKGVLTVLGTLSAVYGEGV